MIKKVLIANRSEIACRIIKTCQEMNINTVAIYSDVDKNSLHVQLSDEAVLIGPAPANQSYLNQDAIIKAALDTNCDAIHPGYGFLSENPEFNRKVRDAGLIFIGPSPEPTELLGSKVASRELMIKSAIPVIQGMKTSSKNIDDFINTADRIGYPVLIKASAGGGGKGMRIVYKKEDLENAVNAAMRESLSAFGSDEVYLEKYIEQPRHVEFQVAADHYGNAIHLFERECSIQRRHQKIIEETPSTALDDELRHKMGETAIKVVKVAKYDSIGTVEFLVDKDKNFYFLEVNTRIQVEHPITEMTTGLDLVKLQIQIADNQPLSLKQEDISKKGHSIECRIYAEDSDNNFLPSSGKILFYKPPVGPGIRNDTGIYQDATVSVFYDPILAKLVVWGQNRDEAINRMILALKDNIILGVKTSTKFMIKCLEHPEFKKGNTFTDFIEKNLQNHKEKNIKDLNIALTAAVFLNDKAKKSNVIKLSDSKSYNPWLSIGKWEILGSK